MDPHAAMKAADFSIDHRVPHPDRVGNLLRELRPGLEMSLADAGVVAFAMIATIGHALLMRWEWQRQQERKLVEAGPGSRRQRAADAVLLIVGSAIASAAFFYWVTGRLITSGSLAALVLVLWVQSWRIRLQKEEANQQRPD